MIILDLLYAFAVYLVLTLPIWVGLGFAAYRRGS